MKTVKQLFQSEKMKTDNADKARLKTGRAMYLAGKVRLSLADEVAKQSNNGGGWR